MTDHRLFSHHITSGRVAAHIYPGQEHYIIRDLVGHSVLNFPGDVLHGLTDDDIAALEHLWEDQALDTILTPTAPWQIIAHLLSERGYLGQYPWLGEKRDMASLCLDDDAGIGVARHSDGFNVSYRDPDGGITSRTVSTTVEALNELRSITSGHPFRLAHGALASRIMTRAALLGITVTRETPTLLHSPAGGVTILPPDEDGRQGIGRTWDGASVRSHSDWDLITYALDTLLG